MLTSLRIQNFKSWVDTGPVRLAPLTVIFGGNSAGKSSLGHLLLALKQTALSSDRKRALDLGDSTTAIDLGTFADCLHGHDLGRKLQFELSWHMQPPLKVEDVLKPQVRFTGTSLALESTIMADPKTEQPRTEGFRYTLSGSGTSLEVSLLSERNSFELTASPFELVRARGRPPALEAPEKFYRLSEASIARFQNAGFLTDFALATEAALRRIAYLGPLREAPQRTYQWSGNTPEDVGQTGRYAVAALLAADAERRQFTTPGKKSRQSLSELIATQLQQLGIIERFTVKPVAEGQRDYQLLVRTGATDTEVKITDVGFGVSQVLPALVQAFYCPPNSTVWMEQPEIHLHPQVQAELADVFIRAVQARENGKPRKVQLVVESHSEHFLNRLQRRIAEQEIDAEDVAIYFAGRKSGQPALEPLRLNKFGDIENWPEKFFGNDMEDLTARAVAAAKREAAE